MTSRRTAKAYSAAKMERTERPYVGANTHERRKYNQVDRRETRALLRSLPYTHTSQED